MSIRKFFIEARLPADVPRHGVLLVLFEAPCPPADIELVLLVEGIGRSFIYQMFSLSLWDFFKAWFASADN